MIESGPRVTLVKTARLTLSGFVVDRLEELSNNGIPDIVITGLGVTTWWEFKLARDGKGPSGFNFNPDDNQHLKMRRLAGAGFARYIIYDYTGRVKRQVRIVHPRDMNEWRTSGDAVTGFDHLWVIEFIRKVHSHYGRRQRET